MGDERSLFNLPSSDQLLSLVPVSHPGAIGDGSHFVQFYDNDYFLLDSITKYVSSGLKAGDACVVIATEEHRNALSAKLMRRGLDVVNDGLGDRYFAYDAQKTLARFLINHVIDAQLFRKFAGEIVAQAGRQGRHVRAFGEMVALLARQGNFKAAIQLEQLWNELQNKHEFSLFCAYSLNTFSAESSKVLIDICGHHSQVIPVESYNILTNAEERLRAIVVLQQKATALEKEIAERQKAEQALQAATNDLKRLLISEQLARAEAEMANRMKDEFLATVSHELRTPLNAIIGWTHMLSIGKLDEEATDRAVETIERNAKAQAQLIEDILDVSRVITGKLQLHLGPVDLVTVVNAALDAIRPAFDAKEIKVKTNYEDCLRVIVGDADRLQQVVWNLLSNASKFTPVRGAVGISITQDPTFAQIQISDTGPGIAPDFLPHVFERFRQADGSTTRMHGGLGLGLAIVRHLVELHGGLIGVENGTVRSGAVFTVQLPLPSGELSLAPAPITSATDEKVGHTDLEDLHILVVEDELDALDLLAIDLREHGAKVTGVSSATQALELLRNERFDLIISDIGMADTDGYSLIKQVRAEEGPAGQHTPAIALTAYARAQDRIRALTAGYNTHVAKPVEIRELVSVVKCLTGKIG